MPNKRLIRDELQDAAGEVCALGCLGKSRKIDMKKIDADEPELVAKAFGIPCALAQEIEYVNDEDIPYEITPEQRYEHVLAWIRLQIKKGAP